MQFCELWYAIVGSRDDLVLSPLEPLVGEFADLVQDGRAHVALLDLELPGDTLLHLFFLVIRLLAKVAPVVLIPYPFFKNRRVS